VLVILHFTTKHVCYVHMLASYMWCTNLPPTEATCALCQPQQRIYLKQLAMAAGHVQLLALAQTIAFYECWNKLLRTYTACKLLSRGIDGSFWWLLDWEWIYDQV